MLFSRTRIKRGASDSLEILSEPERFQPIYRTWLENARAGLTSGMEYSRAIKNRRVRAATVLPGVNRSAYTSRFEASGPAALQRTVKVPRREVRAMIFVVRSCARIAQANRRDVDRAKL